MAPPPWYGSVVAHDELVDRLPFETARLELARLRIDAATERGVGIDRILALCARTLHVERVGFWTFSDRVDDLVCERLYTLSLGEVGGGEVLRGACHPAYRRALRERRVIVAHDALHQAETHELAAGYLTPLGITSMLDAPVFRGGEPVGVLCHEHIGPARTWTEAEISFAGAAADLLSMLLEQLGRLAAQEQLRQRLTRVVSGNQLGALEQLARSVAHDFANVVMAVELVARQLATRARAEDRELVSGLEACAELGDSLVGQLRRFGGRAEAPRRLPLVAVLDRIVPIVRTLTREVATLEVAIALGPDDEAAAPVDQIEQLVVNLCLNARDASPVGATITLAARAVDDHLELEVADQGSGMTPEVLARIWEPYFTTKPHGNGIGLATVKAIVEDAGGTIAVETAPGTGSRFTVCLPRRR